MSRTVRRVGSPSSRSVLTHHSTLTVPSPTGEVQKKLALAETESHFPIYSSGDQNDTTLAIRERSAALQDAIGTEMFDWKGGMHSRALNLSLRGHHVPVKEPFSTGDPSVRLCSFPDLARQTTSSSSTNVETPFDSASESIAFAEPRLTYPGKTSLEVLREVQRRKFSTSSSSSYEPSGTSRGWFRHKEDMDPLLNEQDRGDSEESAEDKIRRQYHAPKGPVVLAHGLLGFDLINVATVGISYWRGIKEALETAGCQVLVARVPATSSIRERASVLEKTISDNFPGERVHLIGHSMGGLDCRYLVTHLRSDRFTPISVTTVATPHRGSSFADYFLEILGRERIPSFLALLDKLPIGGGDGTAFETLTIKAMSEFNLSTPDVDGVKYFSYGAACTPGLLDAFKFPHSIILEKEGPNDGLVSVSSSQWGKYMGTLEPVNHMDLIGWVNFARYAWADLTGKAIQFKPATFYLGIVDMLAVEVEGRELEGTPKR